MSVYGMNEWMNEQAQPWKRKKNSSFHFAFGPLCLPNINEKQS